MPASWPNGYVRSAPANSRCPRLVAYEAELTSYGFDVVRHSARYGNRIMNQEPLP